MKKGKFQCKYIVSKGLSKVKFRWNQVSSQQHRILRGKKKKNLKLLVCFLLPPKGERKKSLTLGAYFLLLETPCLPAYYPLKGKCLKVVDDRE